MATRPEKEQVTDTKTEHYVTPDQRNSWLVGLGVVIAPILIFLAGIGIGHHREMVFRTGSFVKGHGIAGEFDRHRFLMDGGPGSSMTNNGQTRTSGVVTSVNGSSFTLAGNGATTNVLTSSSTQYHDGNQVKQNDTVIVYGTTSNGTLNATEVVINP